MIAASLLLLVLLSLLPSSEAWTIKRTAPGLGRTFQRRIGSCVASVTRRNALMTDDTKRCSLDIREMLPPDQWVHSVLQSLTPASLEEIKDDNRASSCLINDPESTMSHDFIDVDGTFQNNIKEIESTLEAKPSPRSKRLLATVKGSGGGKTRLLEEFRRYFKEREDTVAIGVTFNCNMSYSAAENFIRDDDFLALNLLLSVMTRIVAVVYEQPFGKVHAIFSKRTGELDYDELIIPVNLAIFFRSFLNTVIDSLAEIDPEGKLKNLILLMDETVRPLDENLQGIKAARKREQIKRQFQVFLSALNKGVLDERLGGATGREWNAALLISSLDVSPVRKTLSHRPIGLLPTGVLSSERVVDDWWRKSVLFESSNVTTAKLGLLVEVLKSVPRLVETARDFLVKQAANSSTSGPLKIDAALIRPLFETLLKEIKDRYSVPQNISPRKLFGLIYGRMVKLDEQSVNLMSTSFFTNTLDEIQVDTERQEFIPQGNLVMLAYYDRRRCKEQNISEAEDWNDPNKIFLNVYRAVANSTVDKGSEGDALEKATLGWMMARLIAAQKAKIKKMPLHEFFAVPEKHLRIRQAPPIHVEIPTEIDVNNKVFEGKNFSVLSPMSDDYAVFASKLNEIQMENGTVVAVFSTGKGQNCDFMVVFKIAGTDELFVVFIDNKCKQVQVHQGDTDPRSPRAKTLDVAQFFHVQNSVKELVEMEKNGVKLSPICKALVKGNFRYIYLTTHPEVKLKHDGKKVEEKPDRLVVMTEEATKNFFGILWGLYRAACGLYDAVVINEDGEKMAE